MKLTKYVSYYDEAKTKIKEEYSYAGANIEALYYGAYKSYYEDGVTEISGTYNDG